jgi:hypothetical protein
VARGLFEKPCVRDAERGPKAFKKAKATHWKEFLDKAGEGQLWKVATYMHP